MKVAILQPNYIPWRGYFDLMDDVDLFVFHDDIQYTKDDWRNRNLIKTSDGTVWLTVPVHYRATDQLINQTCVDYSQKWVKKHLNLIRQWYSQSPHFDRYVGDLTRVLEEDHETISTLNIVLCRWIAQVLDIKTKTCLSSELGIIGKSSERVIHILKEVGATSYLSGPSASAYLDASAFEKNKITLEYKVYDYRPYRQLWGDFDGAVSVLDLMFNLGPDARSHLKSLSPSKSVGDQEGGFHAETRRRGEERSPR